MYTLMRVLSNERKALLGAGLLLATALLFSATLMYYVEGDAQPEILEACRKLPGGRSRP